ncbi:PAS domain-containing protein [Chitinophaga horti]|uniref:PAS domain-containing protein n=1 Tax=Chitinophaga horti TaxID=2920382 RepID=A0ABY6J3W6_9BACT|nr:PAS domain-containing protein [Chitinophaga horti]UYQ94358.1 PAS domain-containing protein [Chitinophaga horti]
MKTTAKQSSPRFNAPLMSWDIFISYYHRNLKLGSDVQELDKLAADQNWHLRWDFAQALLRDNKLVIVTDPERQILFISSNLWEITGYSADAVLHQQLKQFRNKDSDASMIEQMTRAIAAQQPFETEFTVHSQTGRPFPTRLESFPLMNQQGELVNYIIFLKAL